MDQEPFSFSELRQAWARVPGAANLANLRGTSGPPGAPAPSLSDYRNCIGQKVEKPGKSPRSAKAIYTLIANTEWLVKEFSVEREVFFTLTIGNRRLRSVGNGKKRRVEWIPFDRAEYCSKEKFEGLLRSFRFNVLMDFCDGGFITRERHKDSVWHAHGVLVLPEGWKVRGGFDFDAFIASCEAKARWEKDHLPADEAEMYRWQAVYVASATPDLRKVWDFFGNPKEPGRCQAYGFGRVQFTPIWKPEWIGKYAGKYLGKGYNARQLEDKGQRMVTWFGRRWVKDADGKSVKDEEGKPAFTWFNRSDLGAPGKSEFSWTGMPAGEGVKWTAPPWLWRQKCKRFGEINTVDYESMKVVYGPRWGYDLRDCIMETDLANRPGGFTYPTVWHAMADGRISGDDAAKLGDLGSPLHVPQPENQPIQTYEDYKAKCARKEPCKIMEAVIDPKREPRRVFDPIWLPKYPQIEKMGCEHELGGGFAEWENRLDNSEKWAKYHASWSKEKEWMEWENGWRKRIERSKKKLEVIDL